MIENNPIVSIGLPVYNGENFLQEALDSILRQTFENFELIISDNASTDRTEDICREYAAKDQRIRYYRNEENLGAALNYNITFKLSRGRYFKWAAHDDLLAPEYLEQCVKILEQDLSVVLCHSQTVLIDRDNQKLCFDETINRFIDEVGNKYHQLDHIENLYAVEPYERYQAILFDVNWCFEVFGLIRTDALKTTSLIGPYYGSDKVLLAELALIGSFAQTLTPLFYRRCHSEQSYAVATKSESWIINKTMFPKLSGFGKFIFPRLMCIGGYFRAIVKSQLSWNERFKSLIIFLQWLISGTNWKGFFLEVYVYASKSFKLKIQA